MSASVDNGGASEGGASHAFRLISATYRDNTYPGGLLIVNASARDIELRQWAGKKKKEETVIARFHLEPNAGVRVDGPTLVVSELSITLESPVRAAEIAGLLGGPERDLESVKRLEEAESAVDGLLQAREEAVNFLAMVKADPRAAILSGESLWTDEATEPIDAICSAYLASLVESLAKTKSQLSRAERVLGPVVIERLYALAYTIGAVQDALLAGNTNLVQELAALQELGIETTAVDLRSGDAAQRLMLRARGALEVLAASGPVP